MDKLKYCKYCGKELPCVQLSSNRKYCNRKCFELHMKIIRVGAGNPMYGRKKTLEQIEKTISKLRGRKRPKEVVEKIGAKIKRGSECHFWKGGVSNENDRIKKSSRYKHWREDDFEDIDDYDEKD